MTRRWRAVTRALPVLALVAVLGACVPPAAPAPPASFSAIAPPAGATPDGTTEWYWAPAPSGHAVTLGVYRPPIVAPPSTTSTTAAPVTTTTVALPEETTTTTAAPDPPPAPPVRPDVASTTKTRPRTLLLLNGGDGFRRAYETLAQRFAAQGFIVIVGCWYEHPTPFAERSDPIACVDGPTWKGMNNASVADLDALVAAATLVPDVDPARLAILGHSYGAGVALLRAAAGHTEPVISSSGFIARYPTYSGGLPTDLYAADVAGTITAPVLVVHGREDPITPLGQAEALVAAMPAGNPATTDYFGMPASHGFPWQSEPLVDRPGEPMSQRFIEDVSAWLRIRFT